MQHIGILRACATVLSLLATLPASATPNTGPHQPPLFRDTAASLRPIVPNSKVARSRPVAAVRKLSQPLAAPLQPPAARQPAALPAATPALPQQWVTLRGIVVRPTGRPCAGASVYAAPNPRQLVVTDAQGAFTLTVPASAAAVLRVEYFGEGSSRVEVHLPASELLHITLGQ